MYDAENVRFKFSRLRRHFNVNGFSYFLTSKSRIRPVYSNTKKHMRANHIPDTTVNTVTEHEAKNNAVSTNILQTYQQTSQCSLSVFPGGVHPGIACALLACPILL